MEEPWNETILFFTGVALLLAAFLTWRISARRFADLKWYIVIAAFLFWAVFGVSLIKLFWNDYYRLIWPESFLQANLVDKPLLMGLALGLEYGLLGLGLWLLAGWLARAARRWLEHHPAAVLHRLPWLVSPALLFCLLGGLESVPEHLLGIYGFKILEKSPLLQGLQPGYILAFAIPEYAVYWGLVLGLGAMLSRAPLKRC